MKKMVTATIATLSLGAIGVAQGEAQSLVSTVTFEQVQQFTFYLFFVNYFCYFSKLLQIIFYNCF